MTDEAAFLNTILADPADDAPRLIYADWLDERGDDHSSRKAAFLRMTARLLPSRSYLGRKHWEDKLRTAARKLGPRWLAAVSKLPIGACSSLFEFRCPKRWENLRATNNPRVRHCDACRQPVYFSDTIAEAQEHADRGHCVALSLAAPRSLGDRTRASTGRRFTLDQVRALGQTAVLGRVRSETAAEPAGAETAPAERPRPAATGPDRDLPRRHARKPESRRERRRCHRVEED